ncbi:MAG: LysR family transcriptional regulator [Rhodospirillaceae bacterium]|nr:MAG: LysR family transcriptional regulator [Rhodospirillaceae bacterium]
MDKFELMNAFVRVVDSGSFSSAARQLRIGQPAVSKAVAQLEDRLGVRMLLRSTHGLSPTEAGEKFYEHAKKAIEEAEAAEKAARGSGTSLSGRIRVSAAVTFARLHILPKIETFLTAHPDLELDIILDDRNVDLIDTGTDVALRMGDLIDSAATARKIGQARRLVIGAPDYFTRRGEPPWPVDLRGHEVIVYDVGGGGATWTFERGSEQQTVTVDSRLRITAAEGIREAVFHGLGLTISSEWMFSPELKTGKVKAVLTDWSLPPLNLWAVFPAGRQVGAKARTFVSFVEDCLNT